MQPKSKAARLEVEKVIHSEKTPIGQQRFKKMLHCKIDVSYTRR